MKNKQNINFVSQMRNFHVFWEAANANLPTENRLKPHEISLYLYIFNKWNHARFPKHLDIHRAEIMQMCGIGNHRTYTKVLRKLRDMMLISYNPSQSKYNSSQVEITELTDISVQTIITTLGISAQSDGQSDAQSSVQGDAQSSGQGDAPLYKTIETNNFEKEKRERNSPLPLDEKFILSEEKNSLSEEKKDTLTEKIIKWVNSVRTETLGLGKLTESEEDLKLYRQSALKLYALLAKTDLDFNDNLFFIHRRFNLYAKFLEGKPDDQFLRVIFTPQGLVGKGNLQQFEQGAEKIEREMNMPLPDKWDKTFYAELVKSKNEVMLEKYQTKLREEKGVEVYHNNKINEYAISKIQP